MMATRGKVPRGRHDNGMEAKVEEAYEKASEALRKVTSHEELCAERYQRLDKNVGKLTHLLLVTLLAVAGTFGVLLLELALKQ